MTRLPEPRKTLFRNEDRELHLFHWERRNAPRIVLVHGIGMGHSVYDRFIGEIGETCDVLAIDLPGFADCPEPADPLSIPGTADLIARALDDIGSPPIVAVGHSMGGQIVAELAARHPGIVQRAVLIAPSVNPAERSVVKQGARMLQDLVEGEPFTVVVRATKTYLQAGPIWFMKKLQRMLEHRVESCLPNVRQPALVIRGVQDRVCPRGWAVRMTALMPNASMRQIPGRGHEALISSGQPVAETILDWLDSTTDVDHLASTPPTPRAS